MSLDERKAMWQQRIEAFQLSGESNIKAWCQKHEVDSKGMYRWMSKLKLESTSTDAATQWNKNKLIQKSMLNLSFREIWQAMSSLFMVLYTSWETV